MDCAIQQLPEDIQFLSQRSDIFNDMNQYNKAIKDLTVALTLRSEDPQLYYKRGISLYKHKQYEDCVKDMYKAIEFNAFNTYLADIYYHLGICFANLGFQEKSIDPLSKALNLNPTEAVYLHERAKCFLIIENYNDSITDFTSVLNLQPKNSHAFFGRGFAYKGMKKYKEAADDFETAKELNPQNPRIYINYSKISKINFIELCTHGEETYREDTFEL